MLPIGDCPSCGSRRFRLVKSVSVLVGISQHTHEVYQCNQCGVLLPESPKLAVQLPLIELPLLPQLYRSNTP